MAVVLHTLRAVLPGMRARPRSRRCHRRRVVTEFLAGAAGEEETRRTYGAFDELRPEDIADAILYAVGAP